MALVLSLLTAFSVPAFAVTCRVCNDEVGCEAAFQATNTWCRFVLNPADCRQVSSVGCTPASPPMALLGEFDVASVELTRSNESITITSDYQPTVAELQTAADASKK
jgi:hypothetical protein